jgi:hypothetical protein
MQLTVGNVVGDNQPDLIWHNLATGQVTDLRLWNTQQHTYVLSSSVLGTA